MFSCKNWREWDKGGVSRGRATGHRRRQTYLDQGLGDLEEVLLSLRSRTLARPVEDGLVADAIGVVQNLLL